MNEYRFAFVKKECDVYIDNDKARE